MSSERDQSYDCFVSYASEDGAYAAETYRRLSAGGIRVWFDQVCIVPGDDYRARILEGCRDGRVVLVPILTPHWGRRDWTKYETFGARGIVPILAEGCLSEVMPDPLRNIQAITIDFGDPDKNDWLSLFRAIRLKQREIRRHVVQEVRPKNLPYNSIKEMFKGREAMLVKLREHLVDPAAPADADIQPHVLHGLGGVGKSRLAVEFAWRHEAEFSALLFVKAASPASFRMDLAALSGPLVLDLGMSVDDKEEAKIGAVLRWLDEHPGWLLIVDNVDDEQAAEEVKSLLPRLTRGRVLITSRLADWSTIVELPPLDLQQLPLAAATEYLLAKTESGRVAMAADEDSARTLADELGCLALALEQAGAYINKRRLSIPDYLRRLHEKAQEVLDWHDKRLLIYEKSVALTWITSFQQLSPAGRSLLQLLAWLAPDPIPVSLLEGDPSLADERLDALADLEGYCFAKRTDDGRWISVHRLVQEITRRRESAGPGRGDQAAPSPEGGSSAVPTGLLAALRALDVGAPANPKDTRDLLSWAGLQPHVAAAAAQAEKLGIEEPTARLLCDLGTFLVGKAVFAEAEGPLKKALSMDRRRLGDRHPDVARDLVALSRLLRETERIVEAEEACRLALAIDEEGSAGPVVIARDLIGLGEALFRAKRLPEREPLYRRALELIRKQHGESHPAVAECLNNLGSALQDLKRYEEAETLYRRSIAVGEQVMAPTDRDLAIWNNNLATLLGETGHAVEAEAGYRKAIAIFEAGPVPDHPDLAIALSSLATKLISAGDLGQAEPLLARALEIRERRLGKEHSLTVKSVFSLAGVLAGLGKLRQLSPLAWRLVEDAERRHGAKSNATEAALLTYLDLIQRPGAFQAGAADSHGILGALESVIGGEDKRMFVHVLSLARLYEQSGEFETARALYERAISGNEALAGKAAAATLTAMNNLAMLLEQMERWDEAEEVFRQALARKSDEVVLLGNYAFLLQNVRRDHAGASRCYLLAIKTDPKDSINRTNFAGLCLIMNNHAAAEEHLREAWRLSGERPDRFTGRILLLRAVLLSVLGRDPGIHLGQLKSLLGLGISPMPWRNTSLRELIKGSLPAGKSAILDALYVAMNEPDGLQRLNGLPEWQDLQAVPLNLSWQ